MAAPEDPVRRYCADMLRRLEPVQEALDAAQEGLRSAEREPSPEALARALGGFLELASVLQEATRRPPGNPYMN